MEKIIHKFFNGFSSKMNGKKGNDELKLSTNFQIIFKMDQNGKVTLMMTE